RRWASGASPSGFRSTSRAVGNDGGGAGVPALRGGGGTGPYARGGRAAAGRGRVALRRARLAAAGERAALPPQGHAGDPADVRLLHRRSLLAHHGGGSSRRASP